MAVSGAISHEASVLCVAMLAGAALFFLYDILRILRRVVVHGTWLVAVEDFLYWLVCTGTVLVMLYRENDGMVRGFALGGVAAGMAIYYVLLSRLFVRVNVAVWTRVLGFLRKILGFVVSPFAVFWKKVSRFCRKQLKKFARAVKMGLSKH